MNELATVFSADGISMADVVEAASTKWNFARFSPGLVGGHCIAVDPYYLIERARKLEIPVPLVTMAREVNENFAWVLGRHCYEAALKRIGKPSNSISILVLGLSYKPDVSDMRESKALDVVSALCRSGVRVDAADPLVDTDVARIKLEECGARLGAHGREYDVVFLCVAHEQYKGLGLVGLSDFLRRDGKSFIADPFHALDLAWPSTPVQAPGLSRVSSLLNIVEPLFPIPQAQSDRDSADQSRHWLSAGLFYESCSSFLACTKGLIGSSVLFSSTLASIAVVTVIAVVAAIAFFTLPPAATSSTATTAALLASASKPAVFAQHRIVFVTGARPNIMKVAPMVHALRRRKSTSLLSISIVHTGQHFSDAMAGGIFSELGIHPDVQLHIAPGSASEQTASILVNLQHRVLLNASARPDVLVVVGDVTSTIAAALAAMNAGVPVWHVEAGKRSFDRGLPEEANRIVVSHIACAHFASEEAHVSNILREGVAPNAIHIVGNMMIDSLLEKLPAIRSRSVHVAFNLTRSAYIVVEFHRNFNTDEPAALERILGVIAQLPAPVVWSVHPRVSGNVRRFGLERTFEAATKNAVLLPPLGYSTFIGLVDASMGVVTDSGGLQEETTALGRPCVTVRPSLESLATLQYGTNVLVWPPLVHHVQVALERAVAAAQDPARRQVPYWDGRAAERFADVAIDFLASGRWCAERDLQLSEMSKHALSMEAQGGARWSHIGHKSPRKEVFQHTRPKHTGERAALHAPQIASRLTAIWPAPKAALAIHQKAALGHVWQPRDGGTVQGRQLGAIPGKCDGLSQQSAHGAVLVVNLQSVDASWIGGAAFCIVNLLRAVSKLAPRVAFISPLCGQQGPVWKVLNASDPPLAESYSLSALCSAFSICEIKCSPSAAAVSRRFIQRLPDIAKRFGAKLVIVRMGPFQNATGLRNLGAVFDRAKYCDQKPSHRTHIWATEVLIADPKAELKAFRSFMTTNRILVHSPAKASRLLHNLPSTFHKRIVLAPPLAQEALLTMGARRLRHYAQYAQRAFTATRPLVICYAGALRYNYRSSGVFEMVKGFEAIRAEFGPAVKLYVYISPKMSKFFRKSSFTGSSLQSRTNARLVTMMDNITSGLILGITGGFELPHEQTVDLWSQNCSVGVRGLRYDLGHLNAGLKWPEVTKEQVVRDMHETMSTKVVEMMAVGLPIVMNPFTEHVALLGEDYPLWWGNASPNETEADSTDSFRASIAAILRSPETLVKAGLACYNAANTTFSDRSFMGRLSTLLDEDAYLLPHTQSKHPK